MKYTVVIPLFAQTFMEVEANSKEEALEKALIGASEPTLCHQCAHKVEINAINDEHLDIDCVSGSK